MKQARQWLMRLGPARVVLTTVLPAGETAAAMRARGEPVLFELAPAYGPVPHSAGVQHVVTVPGRAGATWDGSTLIVHAAAEELPAEGLLYLAYLVVEAERHRHGLVTLHAAAVCRDGAAVLLLGSAGAGKTTTALRLCRDHGAALAGNDLVVAGGCGPVPEVLAGSCRLRLRHASVARVMPELLGMFPDDVSDPWRAKRDIEPARLGIGTAAVPAPIVAVIFIHVDAGYPAVVNEPGDTLVHRLNLHENAVRYIRGASTPWVLAEDRKSLERLLARSRYVAGPPAAVARHVAALLAVGVPALVNADMRRSP